MPEAGSKGDAVHAHLKADIEAGDLAPGTPLVETALVARTGASRTPVREALRRLAAEGLVDLLPRQGARVSRISLRSVRDLVEFRRLLEPEAVAQVAVAAQRDPALLGAVRDVARELEAIRRRPPSPERARDSYALGDRFDLLVVDATRNAHLRRAIADMRSHTFRLRVLARTGEERLQASLEEHLAMCEAVVAGDAAAAARAAAYHLDQGLRATVAALLQGADLDALVDVDPPG